MYSEYEYGFMEGVKKFWNNLWVVIKGEKRKIE